jgi:hypothetical protein
MQFLQTVRLILSLLPLIIEAVRSIEAAFPQSGQGANKLAAVRQTIEAAYAVANDAAVAFASLWPAIEQVVGAVVVLQNAAEARK